MAECSQVSVGAATAVFRATRLACGRTSDAGRATITLSVVFRQRSSYGRRVS
jgi:hypothetical protein